MLTLLVPTDFSKNARAATDYAITLIGAENCSVVLYHTFQNPGSRGGLFISLDELMRADGEKAMSLEVSRIKEKFGDEINIKSHVLHGDISDYFDKLIDRENVDLVVMGTKGSAETQVRIFGSNTIKILRICTNTTALVVPYNENYSDLKNTHFVLASDMETFMVPQKFGNVLEGIKNFCDSKLTILHNTEEGSEYSLTGKEFMKQCFPGFEITYINPNEENVEDAINKHVAQYDSSLIGLVHKRDTILDRLLGSSITKHLTFTSNSPLLVIKE
jgi:nucleotide-binding universal stress UspA family protein